jgi:hypothetical protein
LSVFFLSLFSLSFLLFWIIMSTIIARKMHLRDEIKSLTEQAKTLARRIAALERRRALSPSRRRGPRRSGSPRRRNPRRAAAADSKQSGVQSNIVSSGGTLCIEWL